MATQSETVETMSADRMRQLVRRRCARDLQLAAGNLKDGGTLVALSLTRAAMSGLEALAEGDEEKLRSFARTAIMTNDMLAAAGLKTL